MQQELVSALIRKILELAATTQIAKRFSRCRFGICHELLNNPSDVAFDIAKTKPLLGAKNQGLVARRL